MTYEYCFYTDFTILLDYLYLFKALIASKLLDLKVRFFCPVELEGEVAWVEKKLLRLNYFIRLFIYFIKFLTYNINKINAYKKIQIRIR